MACAQHHIKSQSQVLRGLMARCAASVYGLHTSVMAGIAKGGLIWLSQGSADPLLWLINCATRSIAVGERQVLRGRQSSRAVGTYGLAGSFWITGLRALRGIAGL